MDGHRIIQSSSRDSALQQNYTYALQIPSGLADKIRQCDYNALDEPTFGQYATLCQTATDEFIMKRDPLGVEKLFYTFENGQVHFASNFLDLLKHQQPIYSAPRGADITLSVKEKLPKLLSCSGFSLQTIANPDWSIEQFQTRLRQRLETVFKIIKRIEKQGNQVFVALSGGLDSSIIAHLAAQYLDSPIACTLDLGNTEDAQQSRKIAESIKIRHLNFEAKTDSILDALDIAPILCQDYRDFNVHCAALNILLAKSIKNWADKHKVSKKRLILTGDLMNEFTCDYHEERIDNKSYYRLPRIPQKALQKHLIAGLDTSDRELSPFKSYGLTCIQPYAACFDLYLEIPEKLLEQPDIKRTLNDFMVPGQVSNLQPKEKLRAQVGDRNSMGILGLCHRNGITQDYFLKRILSGDLSKKHLIPIHMGRYVTQTT